MLRVITVLITPNAPGAPGVWSTPGVSVVLFPVYPECMVHTCSFAVRTELPGTRRCRTYRQYEYFSPALLLLYCCTPGDTQQYTGTYGTYKYINTWSIREAVFV